MEWCQSNGCADGLVRNDQNICGCPADCKEVYSSASNLTMDVGSTAWWSVTALGDPGSSDQVAFSSNKAATASVSPVLDDSGPTYRTLITALQPGTARVRGRARVSSDGTHDTCDTYVNITVNPLPVGTIRARVKLVGSETASCTDIENSTDYPPSASISVIPAITPATLTQTSSNYVQWDNVTANTYYMVSADAGAAYSPVRSCWTRTPTTGSGDAAALLNEADTITWDIGLKLADPWVQVADGDAIVATTITNALPPGHVFNTKTGDNTNGLVTYGSVAGYDFSPDPGDKGESQVSTTGWLAESAGTGATKDPFVIDWYQYFANKFDVAGLPNQGVTTLNSKPNCTNPLYYNSGSLTIDGANWTVGANEKCVIIVNGPLTINKNINISSGGFATFIVNGNITIDPTVGKASSLSSPALEGIFVTSRAGIFNTGTSGVGTERFVLKGMVIAGGFQLPRDLKADNTNISSELFLYNPALLFSMPTQMQDLKVRWEEVAP